MNRKPNKPKMTIVIQLISGNDPNLEISVDDFNEEVDSTFLNTIQYILVKRDVAGMKPKKPERRTKSEKQPKMAKREISLESH